MAKPIVVIGSSNIDFTMKMDHLPQRDESVPNAEFMQTFGGKGANQAVAAARAGGTIYFVNCVGDDPYSERMVAGYKESGVNTNYIFHEKGISSGTALIMIGEGGHNYLSVAPGANGRLLPERVEQIRDLIGSASYVLMQFEIPLPTIEKALEVAWEEKVPVVWNFAPAQEMEQTRLTSHLQKVEILVVNEPEAGAVSGVRVTDQKTAEEAGTIIRAQGAKTVIVTLGEAGSVVITGDGNVEAFHVPAFPVEPLDTTAAGDTYCGCLAVALAEGKSFREAVRFAGAAAALSVQKMGAQPSTPWRRDIDAFLEKRD